MKPPITESSSCSNRTLLEFLDGELTADQEQKVATHIASCPTCQLQITEQKRFLDELDGSFRDEPEIPAGFSKIVSASAKSQISGIRRSYERRTAVTVCLVLLSIAMLAAIFLPANVISGPTLVFEKILSVMALSFSALSDVLLGVNVVGRAVSASFGTSPILILGGVIGSLLVLAFRRYNKITRVSRVGGPSK